MQKYRHQIMHDSSCGVCYTLVVAAVNGLVAATHGSEVQADRIESDVHVAHAAGTWKPQASMTGPPLNIRITTKIVLLC